jgi:RNA polymerase sigma factor (sigma-70 family)
MLHRDFPRLDRVHETGSVLHETLCRLFQTLPDVHLPTVRHFFAFAAKRMRWVLLDMAHRAQKEKERLQATGQVPDADTQDHRPDDPADDTDNPAQLAAWTEFHRKVDELPPELQEIFELIWYHGKTQVEAAGLLELHAKEASRRWLRACLLLSDLVPGFENLLQDRS